LRQKLKTEMEAGIMSGNEAGKGTRVEQGMEARLKTGIKDGMQAKMETIMEFRLEEPVMEAKIEPEMKAGIWVRILAIIDVGIEPE